MAEILYSVAGEILKNLGSRSMNEIASAWGFKDSYEQLKDSITMVRNVLLDAEAKQTDSCAVRDWLARLTAVVYAADDLFDEFNIIASRKQLLGENNMTKEVQTFFSTSNQIACAFKLSRKIKAIREKLETTVKQGFTFDLASRSVEQAARKRRDQTHSYVVAAEVIGRDADKKTIIDFLLTSPNDEDEVLSVLPIWGMGGMGKTTLAQLVYNDPRVNGYFELKLWACVAEDFDIKVITEKILKSATNSESPNLEMDQIQSRLRKEIGGKRYLLVLDDVWEENPNKWGELRVLLKIGKKGSKVLVTTRLKKVAEVMGTFLPPQLQGLSEEKTWDLFEKLAYKSGEAQQKPHLVNLGKQIVKKCANVPLAIITLGRLCRYEDESKWLSFNDKNLSDVMSILKLSYQHLLYPLKNCFTYCTLFPKDFVLKKEMLIELWMAEGFIITDDEEGDILKLAEDYFLDLLQRGFFQDVKKNDWGDIMSCKMHDFMHDLATEMAKGKCKVATFRNVNFEDKILHLSFVDPLPPSWKMPNEMLKLKLLRTFLKPQNIFYGSPFSKSICKQLVTKLRHLRVLDLNRLGFKSLPRSIGKLIHLRYLNLSCTRVESLPNSITNLQNLQTLNLYYCESLTTLPSSIQKLTNLRSLDVGKCSNLTHMPLGIGKLTLLHKLSMFIVSRKLSTESSKKPTSTAKLSDLKKLNNLRGVLKIRIHGSFENSMLEAREADITSKHGLTELKIFFDVKTSFEADKKNHDEAVLEGLKPHENLRVLGISGYGGQKLPSWAMADNLSNTLPNLVEITFSYWRDCQQVPTFSQLGCLKTLNLFHMERVEYMESDAHYASPSSSSNLFFPSLEELCLRGIKNLKGWWKEVSVLGNDVTKAGKSGQQQFHSLPSMQFSKLSHLEVSSCPNLTFQPLCPNLTKLYLADTNKDLLSQMKITPQISSATTSNSSCSSTDGWSGLKLKTLGIDEENLKSLSAVGLGQVYALTLKDEKLESMEGLGEIFATLSSSLRILCLICKSLRYISNGLEHLTGLERLRFFGCEELELSENEQPIEDASEDANVRKNMPWKAFKASLFQLWFKGNPKVVSLPSEIQLLTNLRDLILEDMEELREIPEWISCLTSLESLLLTGCPKLTNLPQGIQKLTSLNELRIQNCQRLTKKCQHPNGSEWPKIQHIQLLIVN